MGITWKLVMMWMLPLSQASATCVCRAEAVEVYTTVDLRGVYLAFKVILGYKLSSAHLVK